MRELLPYLVLAGVLAVVLGGFAGFAALVRRRGLAGQAVRAAMAAYDEALHVTAYEAYQEARARTERQAPASTPGDPWRRPGR
jgi:hypothetical protein